MVAHFDGVCVTGVVLGVITAVDAFANNAVDAGIEIFIVHLDILP